MNATRTRLFCVAAVAAVLTASGLALARVPVSQVGTQKLDGEGSVTTTNGVRVIVSYVAGARALFAFIEQPGGRRAPLADGTYSLTNGGAIRVRAGRIVWDAFGVVDKLSRGTSVRYPAENAG